LNKAFFIVARTGNLGYNNKLSVMNCVSCGGVLLRVRRTFAQKVIYQSVLKCKACGRLEGLWYLFLLGRRSHCPRCWSVKLQKFSKVDHIEGMYKNPISCDAFFLTPEC